MLEQHQAQSCGAGVYIGDVSLMPENGMTNQNLYAAGFESTGPELGDCAMHFGAINHATDMQAMAAPEMTGEMGMDYTAMRTSQGVISPGAGLPHMHATDVALAPDGVVWQQELMDASSASFSWQGYSMEAFHQGDFLPLDASADQGDAAAHQAPDPSTPLFQQHSAGPQFKEQPKEQPVWPPVSSSEASWARMDKVHSAEAIAPARPIANAPLISREAIARKAAGMLAPVPDAPEEHTGESQLSEIPNESDMRRRDRKAAKDRREFREELEASEDETSGDDKGPQNGKQKQDKYRFRKRAGRVVRERRHRGRRRSGLVYLWQHLTSGRFQFRDVLSPEALREMTSDLALEFRQGEFFLHSMRFVLFLAMAWSLNSIIYSILLLYRGQTK
jgi:hypothetical protein